MEKKKVTYVNIIFWVIFGVLTGVLWAYACPIQVPGCPGVHFRLFAFLAPAIGFLFGPWSGFFSGYLGSIVWGLLSSNFYLIHTPLIDGIGVGLSAMIPAVIMLGKDKTLDDLIENKGQFIWKCMFWSVLCGVVMVITSAFSFTFFVNGFHDLTSADFISNFTWYLLWIGIADIVPIAITPFVVLPLAPRDRKSVV